MKGHREWGQAMTGKFGAGSPAARLVVQAGMGKAAGWGGGDPPLLQIPNFPGSSGALQMLLSPGAPSSGRRAAGHR